MAVDLNAAVIINIIIRHVNHGKGQEMTVQSGPGTVQSISEHALVPVGLQADIRSHINENPLGSIL